MSTIRARRRKDGSVGCTARVRIRVKGQVVHQETQPTQRHRMVGDIPSKCTGSTSQGDSAEQITCASGLVLTIRICDADAELAPSHEVAFFRYYA